MPYKNFGLPEYPLGSDMWEELKNEKRPIMVYGMGNKYSLICLSVAIISFK